MIRQAVRRETVQPDGRSVTRERSEPTVLHVDIIGNAFWDERPELLA